MRTGDKVRISKKHLAFLKGRSIGRNSWRIFDKEYEVFGIKKIPNKPNMVILIIDKEKRKLAEVCESDLEIINQ